MVFLMVVLPALLSLVVSFDEKLRHEEKSQAVRDAEYKLREEVYHYITQTGDYRPSAASNGDEDSGPAKTLETRMKLINEDVVGLEISVHESKSPLKELWKTFRPCYRRLRAVFCCCFSWARRGRDGNPDSDDEDGELGNPSGGGASRGKNAGGGWRSKGG